MNTTAGIDPANEVYRLKRDNNIHRQNAMSFSCLGKLYPTDGSQLTKWRTCLHGLVRETMNGHNSVHPLIIGLAESGIIPSALFHQCLRYEGIRAQWVCSTRRPSFGICFNESHSHSPDHILPLPSHHPSELWFVEDEITTGRTVLFLALNLCRLMNVSRVRFFAIADSRSNANIVKFRNILDEYSIVHSTHALVRLEDNHEDTQTCLVSQLEKGFDNKAVMSGSKPDSGWHFPDQRPALFNQLDFAMDLPDNLRGSLLVVGEAIDIGLKLVQMNPGLSFHHVTLSPWKIDGRHIISRLDVNGNYYLYNYHNIKTPIFILNDPIDRHIGIEVENLLAEKGLSAERLTLKL
ncbi:MAG: hypothetical protein GY749_01385 [Desulfobacteraceae bacterium]|nr:hypothetical protein [Desulfobacteraceae bacterium]